MGEWFDFINNPSPFQGERLGEGMVKPPMNTEKYKS
jgi:hypothetical protein